MPKKYFNPKIIKFLFSVAVCFLLIFFSTKDAFGPFRNLTLRIVYPFQKTFYVIGKNISSKFDFVKGIRHLQTDNERLLKENYDLTSQVASLKDEKQENEKLREQLNLAPRNKFNLEASLVIGQDPQKLGNWLLIDKGSSSGINEGMLVIAYEGILIGKIKEVTTNSAQVELLSNAPSAVNVVDSETEAKGILKGEYGLGIIMDMISQKDLINEGDTIVTSGLGSDIPKGLLIGRVQEIKASPDKLFQQAVVISKVKYSDLELVFVIKN